MEAQEWIAWPGMLQAYTTAVAIWGTAHACMHDWTLQILGLIAAKSALPMSGPLPSCPAELARPTQQTHRSTPLENLQVLIQRTTMSLGRVKHRTWESQLKDLGLRNLAGFWVCPVQQLRSTSRLQMGGCQTEPSGGSKASNTCTPSQR